MRSAPRLLSLIVLAGFSLAPLALFAEETSEKGPRDEEALAKSKETAERILKELAKSKETAERILREQAARDAAEAMAQQPRLSIDFKGGILNQYVAALKAICPSLSIVLDDKARSFPLPAIRLDAVPLSSAVTVIGLLSNGNPDYYLNVTSGAPNSQAVWVITASPRKNQLGTIVWTRSLRPILQDAGAKPSQAAVILKPEVVLSALETALALCAHTPEKANVQFHPDSGLLLLKGSGDQIRVAENMLNQLQESLALERKQREESEPGIREPKPMSRDSMTK